MNFTYFSRSQSRMSWWVLAFAAGLVLGMNGCKNEDFLYYSKEAQARFVTDEYPLVDVMMPKVDILFVVDNSGSMYSHQQNLASNASRFMQKIAGFGTALDWKLGLISTDTSNPPFIGFRPGDELTSQTPDPVGRFQTAVGKLGLNGSYLEMGFDPIRVALDANPNFLRQDAVLALFFLTDVKDQSTDLKTAADFISYITPKKGSLSRIFAYGGFAAEDLNCDGGDDSWNFNGSSYESVINATGGKYFTLCDPDFGDRLADIGEDIVQRSDYARLFLRERPIPRTLRVYYQGVLIPGGAALDDASASWFYDVENNSIVFTSMEFVPDKTSAKVNVVYVKDDGREFKE